MRLVVDTNLLVGELLRVGGRRRLADDRLELFMPEQMWGEARVELPRRVRAFGSKHRLEKAIVEALLAAALDAVGTNIAVVDEPVYAAHEEEGRARSLRDPFDWPLVACALALDAAVWTGDEDLLGTGVPTWTTSTLQGWLDRSPVP